VAYGEYYAQQHDVQHAEQQFTAALAVNKDDPNALLDLAQLKMAEKRPTDAIAYLKHLGDVQPSAQVYGMLGQAYIATHQYAQAKDACARSFSLSRTPATLGCVAGSDYSMKNYKEASQLFDVLDRNVKGFVDGNPQILYMMAVSYQQTNQKGKAADAYRRVLRYIPKSSSEYKKVQQQIADLSRPAPKKNPHG
jgi:tetratricopeptide (TPR) repeat protein